MVFTGEEIMIPDLKFYRHVSYESDAWWPIKLTRYSYPRGVILSLRRRTQQKIDGKTLYIGYAMRYRKKKKR